MPTFVVTNAAGYFMKVNKNGIEWDAPHTYLNIARFFNTYTSKYQAKRHLKELDNVPEGVKIVELLTIEENVNG